MVPRTRYFLVGSGLVVAVGLCTGLVAYYSGALPGRASWRTDLAYVPRTASAIGFANLADIFGSPFHQHLQTLLPTGADRQRFQAETGIDIERDIDSVLLAVSGEGPSNLGALVLARGRFDQTRIEATATAHGATAATYQDVRLLVAPDAGRASASLQGTPCIAFLESGLVALGTRAAIEQGIDASRSGASVSQDSDLMGAAAGIDRIGNAWFVARTTALASQRDLPEVVRQHIDRLRFFAVGADVDRGVRAVVRAEARDTEAAAELRAVVNGAVSAARLMSGRDPRFDSALASVQTSGTGPTIEVQFTIPSELLDAAKGQIPSRVPQ